MYDTITQYSIPGPFAAARASSPMKKSKSSVPLFIFRCPPAPAPPVRYEGLFATAGRPDPDPALPVVGPLVAMAVGKTKDGASLPANPVGASSAKFEILGSRLNMLHDLPSLEKPVPLRSVN